MVACSASGERRRRYRGGRTRPLYVDGAWRRGARGGPRRHLKPGAQIEGPGVIQQFDATTVIEPGAVATVDAVGNLRIQSASRSEPRSILSLWRSSRPGLQQVCNEMDVAFTRSAFSPVIAEADDRSSGIYDKDTGALISQGEFGLPIFVGTMQYSTAELTG